MYCSTCGKEALGNFCSNCGAKLDDRSSSSEPQNWAQEIRYERLMTYPEIQRLVRKHAALAKKRVSADEFLSIAGIITNSQINLSSIGKIGQEMWARLGVKVGKEHWEIIPKPPGLVMVSALCSLARYGQSIKQVHQFEDGCILEAVLPSDMWSWEGALYPGLRREEGGTRADGETVIGGQRFDWGKSKKILEILFEDLKASPA
jgi:hypothetical protein